MGGRAFGPSIVAEGLERRSGPRQEPRLPLPGNWHPAFDLDDSWEAGMPTPAVALVATGC